MGNSSSLSPIITDESLERYRRCHKYNMEDYIFEYIHHKYIIHPMSIQMWIISSKLHYLLERRPQPTYLLVKGIAKHYHNLIEWIDPVLSTTLLFKKVWFCPDSGKMFCLDSINGLTIDKLNTNFLNAKRIVLGNKFNHMFYSKICEKFTQEQI